MSEDTHIQEPHWAHEEPDAELRQLLAELLAVATEAGTASDVADASRSAEFRMDRKLEDFVPLLR